MLSFNEVKQICHEEWDKIEPVPHYKAKIIGGFTAGMLLACLALRK